MGAGVVIVGGGQAGFQVAASLRAGGYAEPIRIVGAEDHPPYQRPPLSKAFLLGKMERERLLFRQPAFYAAQAIELVLGDAVAAIDREARTVTTAAGRRLPYDALVLATGTRVRPLPVPGSELDGVVYLRTLGNRRPWRGASPRPGAWSSSAAGSSGSRSPPRRGCWANR